VISKFARLRKKKMKELFLTAPRSDQ